MRLLARLLGGFLGVGSGEFAQSCHGGGGGILAVGVLRASLGFAGVVVLGHDFSYGRRFGTPALHCLRKNFSIHHSVLWPVAASESRNWVVVQFERHFAGLLGFVF